MSLIESIRHYTPIISQTDIRRGILYRYFASKANQINDIVYEVDRREYERLSRNSYIVLTTMNWKIVGRLEDYTIQIYTGNPATSSATEPVVIPGILTQNKTSVIFASEVIPAIKKQVVNYQEFYSGTTSS